MATPPDNPASALPKRVYVTVLALAALLIAGHAINIVWKREDWPFSHYPMYQSIKGSGTASVVRAFGVVDGQEVGLDDQFFGHLREGGSFGALRRMEPSDRQLAIEEWVRLNNEEGQEGPAMEMIRFYLDHYEVVEFARTKDEPSKRELVFEFLIPGSD